MALSLGLLRFGYGYSSDVEREKACSRREVLQRQTRRRFEGGLIGRRSRPFSIFASPSPKEVNQEEACSPIPPVWGACHRRTRGPVEADLVQPMDRS